ncbi:MAG: hypothetical protein Q6373_020135 [Candidatus Sigynarchaeota archaeon]
MPGKSNISPFFLRSSRNRCSFSILTKSNLISSSANFSTFNSTATGDYVSGVTTARDETFESPAASTILLVTSSAGNKLFDALPKGVAAFGSAAAEDCTPETIATGVIGFGSVAALASTWVVAFISFGFSIAF